MIGLTGVGSANVIGRRRNGRRVDVSCIFRDSVNFPIVLFYWMVLDC